MKKANRNEVPKEYRRNRKKEAVENLIRLAVCFAGVAILAWLFVTFN